MNQATKEPGRRRGLRRWLPLAAAAAAVIAFFALGLQRYLGFQSLAAHRAELLQGVERLGIFAPLVFIAVYAALVAVSIPLGATMTLAGGFLFGPWLGGVYAVVAATLGAAILFLVASTSLGELLRQRAGPWLRKVEAGFRENAASYLFILRIVPVFPFWVVNLVPALLGMRFDSYVVVTFLGIAPATFVYAGLGAGLGAIIDAGQAPDLGIIFQPRVLAPLIALAALAFIPVVYKWRTQRQQRSAP